MRNKFTFLLIILFTGLISAQGIVVETFSRREFHPDGSPEYHLSGKRASVFGAVIKLEEVTLLLYDKNNAPVKIQIAACEYLSERNLIRGKGEIRIEADGFQLDGTGFLVDIGEQSLFIRSPGKMEINTGKANLAISLAEEKQEEKP